MSAIRHCRPGCRECEAAERLLRMGRLAEEAGRTEVADAAMVLAEAAGRKDTLGAALARALLDATT